MFTSGCAHGRCAVDMSTMAAGGGEQLDPFGMTPWNPDPAPQCINMPSMQNPRNIYLSSEDYIALLEAKLKKIGRKNTNGKVPTPKDMIRCLSQTKETQMKAMAESSPDPYISNHDYSCEEQESRLAALQRRLHPERHALHPEELKTLVDNDVLGKAVLEMKAKEHDIEEQAWKRRLSQTHSPMQKPYSAEFTDPSSEAPSTCDIQTSPLALSKHTTSTKEKTAIETKEVNTAEPSVFKTVEYKEATKSQLKKAAPGETKMATKTELGEVPAEEKEATKAKLEETANSQHKDASESKLEGGTSTVAADEQDVTKADLDELPAVGSAEEEDPKLKVPLGQ